jgi:hypothetical protein
VNLFLLVDEVTRDGRDANGTYVGGGWQSGLLTAGGEGVSTPKAAYSALASDFAAGRGACRGTLVTWTPNTNGGNGTLGGGSVKPKAKPKKLPLCKRKQHSTKKHPCRKH